MSRTFLELADAALEKLRAEKKHELGVTAADVLRIFRGGRVLPRDPDQQTLPCFHCGARIIERLENRRHVFKCVRCGRVQR
jgi:hypothetical protein